MQEQLLHFIWHRKLFDHSQLVTTEGHQIQIIHPGIPNQDQGPDFLQARIRIGDQLWAGHVEIHIRSSSWNLHGHERDPHYNNVILHVVWTDDQPVRTLDGILIPCMTLEGIVKSELMNRYHHLMNSEEWIPCASSLSHVPDIIRTSWIERLMAERLESKTNYIRQILERCGNNYEQAFFVMLTRYLGAPANSDPMENLGLKIPLNILRKHGDRTDQIEAILFGVAGMLTKDLPQGYPQKLKKEFDFLKVKYELKVIPSLQWKFMRMRPAHFPTIRLAQLAVIVSGTSHFITLLSESVTASEWLRRFMVKAENEYWDYHYHFKSEAPFAEKRLGINTAESLVINLVAPFMFFYGKTQGLSELKDKAIQLLSEVPAEKNAIIQSWGDHGWSALDAGQSQALLHLKKNYCDGKRCLHCAIGLQIMR